MTRWRSRARHSGLRVKAASAADDYLVATLAVRLLDSARERFERERQPDVVRTAGRVFSAMTDGRYVDVRVPLDGSGVSVVTADGFDPHDRGVVARYRRAALPRVAGGTYRLARREPAPRFPCSWTTSS